MPPAKKVSNADEPFLKTAAQAIGTALGRLAVKTGVAAPVAAAPVKKSVRGKNKLPLASKPKKSSRKTVKARTT